MEEKNKDIKELEVIDEKTTKKDDKKGLCITSLVLGIVTIAFIWLWYVSIPCGVLAIIFGVLGRKGEEKGMAIAGIATGAIGLVISIVLLIVLICGITTGLTKILENLDYDSFTSDIYDNDSYDDSDYEYDYDVDEDTNEDIDTNMDEGADEDIDADYDYDEDVNFE